MTLTGLFFKAGFLSAGFLAASATFCTAKGTLDLQAGLVIFCAGVTGVQPGAGRLTSHTIKKVKHNKPFKQSANEKKAGFVLWVFFLLIRFYGSVL